MIFTTPFGYYTLNLSKGHLVQVLLPRYYRE